MPFDMRNAASTFQRLMIKVIGDIEGCVVYLDDIVIYAETWERHLEILEMVLRALAQANLVINLKKCEFAKAKITYLGHQIGLGSVSPKEANIEAIVL